MGLFSRKQDEPENVAGGGVDGAFEVVDADGKRVRYTSDDFDEIFTTTEAPDMRRHVEIGWLLLDARVGRDPALTAVVERMPGRKSVTVDRRSLGEVGLGSVGAPLTRLGEGRLERGLVAQAGHAAVLAP